MSDMNKKIRGLSDADIANAMVETDPLELGKVPLKVIKEFVSVILRKAQE